MQKMRREKLAPLGISHLFLKLEVPKSLFLVYYIYVTEDPYSSPETPPIVDSWEEKSPTKPGMSPPLVTEHLRGTRPWVKFCSLAGYITAGFTLVIAAITMQVAMHKLSALQLGLLASFYIILAILFIIPSLRLSRYERSITRLMVSERLEDLEQAIAHQRIFWRQMGIMILIIMCLYLLTIIVSAILLLANKAGG